MQRLMKKHELAHHLGVSCELITKCLKALFYKGFNYW